MKNPISCYNTEYGWAFFVCGIKPERCTDYGTACSQGTRSRIDVKAWDMSAAAIFFISSVLRNAADRQINFNKALWVCDHN
jgi:hypothetical protein